jgi:hypothetical protein
MRGPTRLISLLYTADHRERSRFNPAKIDIEPTHKPSVPRNEFEHGAIQSDDKSSHSKGADRSDGSADARPFVASTR